MQSTSPSSPSQHKNIPLAFDDVDCRGRHEFSRVGVLVERYPTVGAHRRRLLPREDQIVTICARCHLVTVEARA